jgi:GTP1/Obg family GTP-binding protein
VQHLIESVKSTSMHIISIAPSMDSMAEFHDGFVDLFDISDSWLNPGTIPVAFVFNLKVTKDYYKNLAQSGMEQNNKDADKIKKKYDNIQNQ